jgi:hypothetical protein
MPIETESAELDFGRIRQGWRRMEKECTVWIVAAADNVSEITERRAAY